MARRRPPETSGAVGVPRGRGRGREVSSGADCTDPSAWCANSSRRCGSDGPDRLTETASPPDAQPAGCRAPPRRAGRASGRACPPPRRGRSGPATSGPPRPPARPRRRRPPVPSPPGTGGRRGAARKDQREGRARPPAQRGQPGSAPVRGRGRTRAAAPAPPRTFRPRPAGRWRPAPRGCGCGGAARPSSDELGQARRYRRSRGVAGCTTSGAPCGIVPAPPRP